MPKLLIVFLILFVASISLLVLAKSVIRIRQEKKSRKEIMQMISSSQDDDRYKTSLLAPERYLVTKFKIPDKRVKPIVYAGRILLVAVTVLSWLVAGAIGVALCLCVGILLYMDASRANEIEKSGVTRLPKVVSFIDYFVPQILSGHSAESAFLQYVQSLEEDDDFRPLLIEYIEAKTNGVVGYRIPDAIKDVVSIYEDAVYNETVLGESDYTYIIQEAKRDLFQKSTYYSEYNTRVQEVLKPIELAYYVGLPAIIIMLLGTVGDFWFTWPGILTAAFVVLMFFLFKALCNRLAIETLHKIL